MTKTPVAVSTFVSAAMAALISGCGLMNPGGVSNPITPEQSKAQVVDLAREVVHTLNLDVLSAKFFRSSCNDDGVAPFRGEVIITYPLAASMEESDTEIAKMVDQLRRIGWTDDPSFRTHGNALTKNSVIAQLDPQTVSDKKRGITLLGECRDVTTSTKYGTPGEEISLD